MKLSKDVLVRRMSQWADCGAQAVRAAFAPSRTSRRGEGVALIVVNYNTIDLTRLMLASAFEHVASDIDVFIVVENGSSDGSWEVLTRLSEAVGDRLRVVRNTGRPTHGGGLRRGIEAADECSSYPGVKPAFYLIADSDIVFLRPDSVSAMRRSMSDPRVAMVGQVQYDVGEPYVHPSCCLVRADAYHSKGIVPFVDHGAPALWLHRSLRRKSWRIADLPTRTDDYIVHRGQGTVERVRRQGAAHYHGNPAGKQLWEATEESLAWRLREVDLGGLRP